MARATWPTDDTFTESLWINRTRLHGQNQSGLAEDLDAGPKAGRTRGRRRRGNQSSRQKPEGVSRAAHSERQRRADLAHSLLAELAQAANQRAHGHVDDGIELHHA